jgi:hypothetical protein
MRLGGLTAADWAVATEYIDMLKLFKSATKRLEGRSKSGCFGAIAEIILVFEEILSYYKQRAKAYKSANYSVHDKTPVDHLATILRAVWAKASEYYTKLDNSPVYYAVTVFHPYYKTHCNTVWGRQT